MKKMIALVLAALLTACATTTTERLRLPPLSTVDRVELARYLGTWFEIASYPQGFQAGCTNTTATYTLRADGEIDVANRCRVGALDGDERRASGRARVVDPVTNARLEVSFFGPFWGDYWIVDLGDDYEYAVVGHPSRDYLWILSRTPTLPATTRESIVTRLRDQGYDTGRLVETLQPPP